MNNKIDMSKIDIFVPTQKYFQKNFFGGLHKKKINKFYYFYINLECNGNGNRRPKQLPVHRGGIGTCKNQFKRFKRKYTANSWTGCA